MDVPSELIGSAKNDDAKSRIAAIHKDIWIDCPISREPLDAVINILDVPIRTTAPCVLVYGEGGSGKTTIVKQLQKRNQKLGTPYVFLTLVENLSNLKLKSLILDAMGLPTRISSGKDTLPKEIGHYLRTKGIKAIIIDEFNEALLVPKNEQLKNLSLFKGLSGDPYNLSVIAFGTKLARNALQYDEQLARRYYFHELAPWSLDGDFRNFLATLEKAVGLKKSSGIHQEEMLRLIHKLSDGVMNNVVNLVRFSAIHAITSGEERITKQLIEFVAKKPWGYKV